jgi:Divergent InlB B-repeat domain
MDYPGCPGSDHYTVHAGDTVTLQAMPFKDSTFAGWSAPGCGGGETCTLTVSADTSVTAHFYPLTYLLKINNENMNAGWGRTQQGWGLACGFTGTITTMGEQIDNVCQAQERAYDPNVIVDVDAEARPDQSGNWYVYSNVDCGSGQAPVDVEDHLHATCDYANTSTNTTLTVTWQQCPDSNDCSASAAAIRRHARSRSNEVKHSVRVVRHHSMTHATR